MPTIVSRTGSRVLRPHRHVEWRAVVASNLACVLPGLLVAVAIGTFGGGRSAPAFVLVGIVLAAGALASVVGARARIELGPAALVGFWIQRTPAVRVRSGVVAQAFLRTIHNADSVTANRHLFLVDGSGRTRFRMSDRSWSATDLAVVARHFDVPLTEQPQLVHLAELRRCAPVQLPWRERHPVVGAALSVVLGFAVCLLISALCVAAL